MSWLNEIFNWMIEWTEKTFTPLGVWGLFWLAFMEASFFPIPPDILLIILILAKPDLFLFYASICTLGSVSGALFGYFIGYKGGLPLLRRCVSEEKIKMVHQIFNKYEAWAVAIAGITPIPYKLATIGGGVFYVNINRFIIASLLSRGARYFIVATLTYLYGEPVMNFINNYFDIISLSGAVLLIIGYLLYKRIRKKSRKHEHTE